MVRINVDWHLFDKEVPTGMTVMVFPWSGGAPHTVLTNEITHADFSLEPGKYHVLVFNQSTTDLLAELKNRLKISIFLWRKSCASR